MDEHFRHIKKTTKTILYIKGHNPTYDMPYNRSLPYSSRVDMMVEWLMLPPNKRPSLIMAYFDVGIK